MLLVFSTEVLILQPFTNWVWNPLSSWVLCWHNCSLTVTQPKREREVQTSLIPVYTEELGTQNVRKQTDVPLGCWLQFLLSPDAISC